jgi:tetratricopeptide (TPR) repeat protein
MPKIFLILLLVAAAAACAQDRSAAESAMKAQQWEKAAAEYQKITNANPQDGSAWYQMGMALYSQNKFAEAASAFQHAAELKFTPAISDYNTAASLARAGKKDEALTWLEKLPATGYAGVSQVQQDADFAALRPEPRYQAVLAALKKNAAPCEDSPESAQFDFWVGEWDVQTPQGQHAGNSSIQKILGSCVVLENWSGGGLDGKSFNVYNRNLKQWQQYWVDSSGRVTVYTGSVTGGEMRYVAEAGPQNGTQVSRRMTFSQLGPGKVRQLGEFSNDGGKTWSVAYDLIYVKKQ